jgi:hypothetical protein
MKVVNKVEKWLVKNPTGSVMCIHNTKELADDCAVYYNTEFQETAYYVEEWDENYK